MAELSGCPHLVTIARGEIRWRAPSARRNPISSLPTQPIDNFWSNSLSAIRGWCDVRFQKNFGTFAQCIRYALHAV